MNNPRDIMRSFQQLLAIPLNEQIALGSRQYRHGQLYSNNLKSLYSLHDIYSLLQKILDGTLKLPVIFTLEAKRVAFFLSNLRR